MSKLPNHIGWALHPNDVPDGASSVNCGPEDFKFGLWYYNITDYRNLPVYKALKREIEEKGWLSMRDVADIFEDYFGEFDDILAISMMMNICNGG